MLRFRWLYLLLSGSPSRSAVQDCVSDIRHGGPGQPQGQRGLGHRPHLRPRGGRGDPTPKGLGQGIRGMAALHGRGRHADLRRGREPDARVAAAAAAVAGRQRGVLRRGARLRGARRLPEMRQLRPGGDALVQPRDLALLGRARRKQGTGPPRVHRLAAQKTRGEAGVPDDRPHLLRRLRRLEIQRLRGLRRVGVCVEINQCDGCSTILY